jgi:hypothetical protein
MHSLALKQDGTVLAFGWNYEVDGKFSGQAVVPNDLSSVIAVAGGGYHSLALKQDGTVVAWGWNYDWNGNNCGQTTVPSGLSNGIAIAGGGYHSLALKQDGTVVTWGQNQYGQTNVPSGLSEVIAIAAGVYHSLALKQDGTVVAWGDNYYGHGQATVPGGLSGVIAIGAGFYHSLALVYPGPLVAPTIIAAPRTQTVEAGSNIRLVIVADGFPLFGYQWFVNGTNAATGGTKSFLDLPGIQPYQAGAYAVVITNAYGAVTSNPAMLSVIPPVSRRTVPVINFTGDAGSSLHLSYADTLGPGAAWQKLDAVALTSTQQFRLDLTRPMPSARFYRFWQANVPSVQPALEMSLATEITLSGAMSSSVRVDRINQFGPTDAWVTLDTVAMTNTTQLYFDLSMFRQPARLYRLVPVP